MGHKNPQVMCVKNLLVDPHTLRLSALEGTSITALATRKRRNVTKTRWRDSFFKRRGPQLIVAECINHVHVFFLLASSEHCHSSVNVEVALRPLVLVPQNIAQCLLLSGGPQGKRTH